MKAKNSLRKQYYISDKNLAKRYIVITNDINRKTFRKEFQKSAFRTIRSADLKSATLSKFYISIKWSNLKIFKIGKL